MSVDNGRWRTVWRNLAARHSEELRHIYDLLCRYHDKYRHPDRDELILHAPHRLPKRPQYCPVGSWPEYSRPGVYIMLDGSVRRVIYVGQAEKLGYRLSNWFRDGSRDARAMQQWKIKPEYVAVVPVQEAHEAASLESYLISRLATTSNIRGRPKEFETMFRSSEEGERHFWRDGVLHTLNSGPRE